MGVGEQIAVAVLFFAILTKNKTVAISTGAMLLLRLLNLKTAINFVGKNGVNIGLILLTAGCLTPFFQNKYTAPELKEAFLSLHGMVGIFAGMAVALLAGQGARCPYPYTVLGVVIGTFVGVGFFNGVAVGPMIGSGIALSAIAVMEKIMGK